MQSLFLPVKYYLPVASQYKEGKKLINVSLGIVNIIVFAQRYRRQIIYGKYKIEIGKILRNLCDRKGIEIIEAQLCPDHIRMLLSIPPKFSVSEIMWYLKGKNSLMIFDRFANLKYREYIRNQLSEDKLTDEISKKE